jgi:N-acetylglucosamine-6-phosphate deacetylase
VYELIGAPVIVKDRRPTRPEDGRLAGSTVTLDQCVLNMVRLAGASFAHSVSMASLVPARVIHLEARLGTLEPGKDANFSVVDQDMRVFRTVVKGRIVFEHSMAAIS